MPIAATAQTRINRDNIYKIEDNPVVNIIRPTPQVSTAKTAAL